MKKYKMIAALLLAAMCSGCGAPASQGGLVTDAVTTDENTTHLSVPVGTETTDVNVRTEDGSAFEYPETTALPEDDGSTTIRFLAAGDNIIHENVFLDAKARAKEGESYQFADMYKGIANIVSTADLAFINQETPICGDELGIYGFPNFNTPEVLGDTLIDLGFDIVNIANNHVLDRGERGYRGTLDYWSERKNDITMIGGYYNKDEYENICVIEEQGVSIAFITYTYSTNNMFLPKNSEMYVPYIDQEEIVRMTKKAKELADLVFVVMHWGDENKWKVSDEQKTLASAITEAGADVIIGMHPHVIQPMEWQSASDGSQTLVIYSLGNLISTQYDNFNLVGGIVTFDIVKSKAGEISIENPIYNPTVTHYNKQRLGLQVYLLENYTAELCALHGTPNFGKDKTWTLPLIKSYATDNIAPEFLPKFITN